MKMNNIQRQRASLEWALDNLKTGFIPSDKQERDRHNRILRRVKDGDCSDENRDLVEEIVNILFGLPESMNDDVCVSSCLKIAVLEHGFIRRDDVKYYGWDFQKELGPSRTTTTDGCTCVGKKYLIKK